VNFELGLWKATYQFPEPIIATLSFPMIDVVPRCRPGRECGSTEVRRGREREALTNRLLRDDVLGIAIMLDMLRV